jgi:hypothetical protein
VLNSLLCPPQNPIPETSSFLAFLSSNLYPRIFQSTAILHCIGNWVNQHGHASKQQYQHNTSTPTFNRDNYKSTQFEQYSKEGRQSIMRLVIISILAITTMYTTAAPLPRPLNLDAVLSNDTPGASAYASPRYVTLGH